MNCAAVTDSAALTTSSAGDCTAGMETLSGGLVTGVPPKGLLAVAELMI